MTNDLDDWTVYCEDCRRDAMNSFPLSDLELTAKERAAADELAKMLKTLPARDRGLTIWKVCQERGVDHHKVARHLGERNRRGKGKPWIYR